MKTFKNFVEEEQDKYKEPEKWSQETQDKNNDIWKSGRIPAQDLGNRLGNPKYKNKIEYTIDGNIIRCDKPNDTTPWHGDPSPSHRVKPEAWTEEINGELYVFIGQKGNKMMAGHFKLDGVKIISDHYQR
jgi:hypothetical protein